MLTFVATIPLEIFLVGMGNLKGNTLSIEQVILLIVFSKVLDCRGFYCEVNKQKLSRMAKFVKYSFTPSSLLVVYSASCENVFLAVIFGTITCALFCYDLVVFEYSTIFDWTDCIAIIFAFLSFGYFVII